MQEYLESARKGGELGRTAGVPYKFCFFLYREDSLDDGHVDQDGGLSKAALLAVLPCTALKSLCLMNQLHTIILERPMLPILGQPGQSSQCCATMHNYL